MKQLVVMLILVCCFSCKNEKNSTTSNTTLSKDKIIEKTTLDYDFSTIPKDTIIVSGKEIVFFLPSKDELQIIKKEDSILEKDSLYRYNIARVKQYLKFPEGIKISNSTKRVIGVDQGNRIRYYDRLDYFKSNYGMLMMYNRTFQYVTGFNTEEELYSIIDAYYRNNLRFEIPIEQKFVVAENGLNIRRLDGTIDGKFNNGDVVDILGYSDSIAEINDDGKILKGRWAAIKWNNVTGNTSRVKKRYVFEGFLGSIDEVKVYKSQICYGIEYETQRLYDITDNIYPKCLDSYFDFDLISEKSFNAIKEMDINFYKENKHVKIEANEDNTQDINLPLKDTTLVFKSISDYKGSSHSFYGDIEFLNQYLMYHIYYEAEDAFFSFIDKTSGKQTIMFQGFPNISPDKKRIISFYYDIYDDEFYLEIFKIKKDRTINFEKGFRFVHWIQDHGSKIKWLSSTEFAIIIVNKNRMHQSDYKPQYLKVKLKF
ncbi:hypothetical protein [uncultured Winogradskyella sp.]|uniref:hypothetical protein n=1 Tax=uncultured Winogradskyella sp. TaxID=395353 RepID=UPI00261B774A|nr:hypothetical protein [uncultured Winogradskyella sp.]